jgi:hypothetical protein
MAKYPVTWNIISFTYAEEIGNTLNKGKQSGNMPTQSIKERNEEIMGLSNFISRQECFNI